MNSISKNFDTAFEAVFGEKAVRELELLRENTPKYLQWHQLTADLQRQAIHECGIDLGLIVGEMPDDLLLRLATNYHMNQFDACEFGTLMDRYLRQAAEPLVLAHWDRNRQQRDLFRQREGL